MIIAFTPEAREDLFFLTDNDKGAYKKLQKLLNEMCRTPYEGTGKPEQLKGELSGYWSRRITDEHRIIYRVDEDNDMIIIVQCKGHYGDK